MAIINTANIRFIVDGESSSQYVFNRPIQDIITEVNNNTQAVVDSVTDATSTNTPNTIVKRDATGSFAANIVTATDVNTTSDYRLKTDFWGVDASIIDKLNPVKFRWKESDTEAYGLIAQEVEQVAPELVMTREDGFKGVFYQQIISLLIENVKQLNNRVSQLEAELSK